MTGTGEIPAHGQTSRGPSGGSGAEAGVWWYVLAMWRLSLTAHSRACGDGGRRGLRPGLRGPGHLDCRAIRAGLGRAAVFVPYVAVPFLAIGLMAAIVNYFLGSHGGFQWWGEFAGLGAAAVSVVWSLEVVFNRTYTAGVNADVSGSFIVQVLVTCLLASVIGGQIGRTIAGVTAASGALRLGGCHVSRLSAVQACLRAHPPTVTAGGPPALERLNARP